MSIDFCSSYARGLTPSSAPLLFVCCLYAQIFEKWRVVATDSLEGEELAEYERDMQESNRRFDQAFRQVLSHTSQLELREFGKLFTMDGDKTHGAWVELLNMHTDSFSAEFRPGPSTLQEGIARKKRSHFAEENPIFEQGVGWRTRSVEDKREGTIVFEHANPVLDESVAATEPSQLRSI